MLWNPYQKQTRSHKILLDTRQKCNGIHINSKQDPTIFYRILDKNAVESISIAKKILQDPTRFYGILDKNAMKSISLANKILQDQTRSYKILQDSTEYLTKMLWNPYQ